MRRGFDSPLALCPPSEPRGVLFEPSHQGRRRSGRENIRGRHATPDAGAWATIAFPPSHGRPGFGGEEIGPHFLVHVSMVRLSHSMVMAACSASASRLVAAREISLVFHSVHRAVRYTAELPPLKYSSNDPLDGGEGKRRACLRQGNAGLRRR